MTYKKLKRIPFFESESLYCSGVETRGHNEAIITLFLYGNLDLEFPPQIMETGAKEIMGDVFS